MRTRTSLDWFPIWIDKWIFGSVRIELSPEERGVFVDLLALAGKDDGYIRANEDIAYLPSQLAGILNIELSLLQQVIQKCIETDKIIEIKPGIYKIKNWEVYQLSDRQIRRYEKADTMSKKADTMSKKADTMSKKADTNTDTDKDTNTDTDKDTNTDKDTKNNIYSPNSDEFRLSSLLLQKILERKPDYKKPDIQKWAKHIDYMIRIDKRNPDDIEKVIIWCQQDSFWQNNILSTATLREKFDRLELQMRSKKLYEEKPFEYKAL